MPGGFGNAMLSGAKGMLGITGKATLTIIESVPPSSGLSIAAKKTSGSGGSSASGDILEEKPVSANGAGLGMLGKVGGGLMPKLPALSTTKLADLAAKGAASALGGVAGKLAGAVVSSLLSGPRKQFSVQFNPSSLHLSAYSGGLVQKADYSTHGPEGISYSSMDTRITMSVQLVFNQVNAKDSFMGDKFATSPVSMATGLVQAGLKAGGLINYSVQKEIEGLIGAIRNERTRRIAFNWGQQSYIGVLNSVNSQYTMFSVSGQPVHGVVNLTLVLTDETQNLAKWKAAYREAFKNDVNLTGTAQKAGNLLNFSL